MAGIRLSSLAIVVSLLVLARVSSPGAEPARITKALTFSILEDYDKGDDLEEVARDFTLMRELGIATWRGSFGWDDFEPERGRYDFAWLHEFMTLAAARGITLPAVSGL